MITSRSGGNIGDAPIANEAHRGSVVFGHGVLVYVNFDSFCIINAPAPKFSA